MLGIWCLVCLCAGLHTKKLLYGFKENLVGCDCVTVQSLLLKTLLHFYFLSCFYTWEELEVRCPSSSM